MQHYHHIGGIWYIYLIFYVELSIEMKCYRIPSDTKIDKTHEILSGVFCDKILGGNSLPVHENFIYLRSLTAGKSCKVCVRTRPIAFSLVWR